MSKIKNFTLFGERNSGTTYLQKILAKNFEIPFTKDYGFKHWYIKGHNPRGRPNQTTDNECLKSLNDSDETLFIFIVRNPLDWLYSMFKKPYHIKTKYKNFIEFISHPYIAYENDLPSDHGPNSKSPWFLDKKTQKYFIEESKNIIALRNQKNNHFNSLRNTVKHFALIRQEFLTEDIQKIVEKFSIPLKGKTLAFGDYRKPTSYKHLINQATKNKIQQSLNNHIDNTFYPV